MSLPSSPPDRPIMMSGPLVRATMMGVKVQTRRISPSWRRVRAGTRLWVKETWITPPAYDHLKPGELPEDTEVRFAADLTEAEIAAQKLRPSMFLPRRFSRLTLLTKSITFEPLNAITEEGAWFEGFNTLSDFQATWIRIHGTRAWIENPEVAVITYEVVL